MNNTATNCSAAFLVGLQRLPLLIQKFRHGSCLFLPVICQKPAYNIYIIRSSCHHFRHLHGNNLLQEINIHLILLTVKQQILINAKI